MKVQYIPTEYAAQSWPQVEKFIEAALKHGHGDYTLDQVKLLVCMGQWLLTVAIDENNKVHGAATISFINYPNERIGFITACGGKFIANKDLISQLFEIAKSRGATKMQAMVRPSMERLLSRSKFKSVSTMVEYQL